MKKVILVIRDGWGHRDSCKDNAICQAPTPITDELMQKYGMKKDNIIKAVKKVLLRK